MSLYPFRAGNKRVSFAWLAGVSLLKSLNRYLSVMAPSENEGYSHKKCRLSFSYHAASIQGLFCMPRISLLKIFEYKRVIIGARRET